MANYTQTTFFAPKDVLPSGDPAKAILGAEVDPEFAAIAAAIATKADSVGQNTLPSGDFNGDVLVWDSLGDEWLPTNVMNIQVSSGLVQFGGNVVISGTLNGRDPGDALKWDGYEISVVSVLPGTMDSGTIYFVTEPE